MITESPGHQVNIQSESWRNQSLRFCKGTTRHDGVASLYLISGICKTA